MRVTSRLVYTLLAGALGTAAGCADLLGPGGPEVTVSLEAPPSAVAARALRVTIGGRSTEVPAPPAGGSRAERALQGPGFGTRSVQVALVGAGGDTLASAAFTQEFQRHTAHWVAGLVGPRRPVGTCVGTVAAAPVRGSLADTLFVMYGGLPDGAIC